MMILALGSRRLRLAPNRVRRLVVVNLSLLEHLSAQSERLCEIFGTEAVRFGLSLSRFDGVRDLFATEDPQGEFVLWHSMVFGRAERPSFKVYLNPEVKGVEPAPELVAEAMHRLGLGASYQTLLD